MKNGKVAPEDVRPGVWLIDPNGNLFQSDGFFYDSDDMLHIVMNSSNGHPISKCFPIPLSPEVLVACGFDYMTAYGSWANKEHWISEGFEDWQIDPFCTNEPDVCIKLKYLHELQNICRSFKTELTINPAQLAEAVKGVKHE